MLLFFLYLYVVILVTLTVSYGALAVGLNTGLDLAMKVNVTQAARQTVSNSVGVFTVAFPLWLAHWFWLRRSLPNLGDPKATALSVVHRIFLYTVLCIMVLAILGWGGAAASTMVGVLIGAQPQSPAAAATFAARFSLLFFSTVLWTFHWWDLSGIPTQTVVAVAPEPVTGVRQTSPQPTPVPPTPAQAPAAAIPMPAPPERTSIAPPAPPTPPTPLERSPFAPPPPEPRP